MSADFSPILRRKIFVRVRVDRKYNTVLQKMNISVSTLWKLPISGQNSEMSHITQKDYRDKVEGKTNESS